MTTFRQSSDAPLPTLSRDDVFFVSDGVVLVTYRVLDNLDYHNQDEHIIGIIAQAIKCELVASDDAAQLGRMVEELLTNPTPAGEPIGTEPEMLRLARKVQGK